MYREFTETPLFTKNWIELGFSDEDLRELQNVLIEDPKTGKAIKGTGGLRKIRVAMGDKDKGKRGGARVIYVNIEIKERIHLIDVYSKNEKLDLSEKEKKTMKRLIEILKEE